MGRNREESNTQNFIKQNRKKGTFVKTIDKKIQDKSGKLQKRLEGKREKNREKIGTRFS